MNKEKLFNRVANISNSMFPLVDFFNDIEQIEDKDYNKEQAYKDIEKICDVVEQLLVDSKRKEKLEIIEKHPISYYSMKCRIVNGKLIGCNSYNDYLKGIYGCIKDTNYEEEPLTETEFNLLKEMR